MQYHVLGFNLHRSQRGGRGFESPLVHQILNNLTDFSEFQNLIVAAKENGHNLKFEPDTLEGVIRSAAFFLPSEYRKDSRIEVIARNKTEDSILLEVSYVCGRLCGSGYHVVLQKDGIVWRYASIGIAWIS